MSNTYENLQESNSKDSPFIHPKDIKKEKKNSKAKQTLKFVLIFFCVLSAIIISFFFFHSIKDCKKSINKNISLKLTKEGLKNKIAWEEAGIKIPSYDIEKVTEDTKKSPRWVHFGIGNIFRVFIADIANELIEKGILDRGIIGVAPYDHELLDKIYYPHDNLVLNVILRSNGTRNYKVIGSVSEVVRGQSSDKKNWERLKEIFKNKDLQMVSFTVTEKAYALKDILGNYLPQIKSDIENGPEKSVSLIAIIVAMLNERYKNGKLPFALVSMDNISDNGKALRNSVIAMAEEWLKKGFVNAEFMNYIKDENIISFPWSMIDKIVPRPSKSIADDLESLGLEGMQPIITAKKGYMAPFVNAEGPQYLVIEDNFPNGRPELGKAYGTYLTDRDTVIKAESMKVNSCLNPVHSALGPFGVLLGIEQFADMLNHNEDIMKMAKRIEYKEGIKVSENPKIITPEAFAEELFAERFINPYLGDTNIRLCTDLSQKVGVRFGETIKSYVKLEGNASSLIGIPLGIAGWLRYLLEIDDEGNKYEISSDPIAKDLQNILKDIVIGNPSSLKEQLKPILSNKNIFFINLYEAGLGEKIEGMFRELIAGKGSVKTTMHKYANI